MGYQKNSGADHKKKIRHGPPENSDIDHQKKTHKWTTRKKLIIGPPEKNQFSESMYSC